MIRFIFLTVFIAVTSSASGQLLDNSYLFGGGASYSSVLSSSFDSKGRIGWNICFGARSETLNDFDIMGYLNFSTMGATFQCHTSDGFTISPGTVERDLYFSNLMGYFFISYPVVYPTLRLNAGFCVGGKLIYNNNNEERVYYLTTSTDPDESIDAGEMINEMWVDYGLSAGISVGTENFELALSYTQFLYNMCRPVNYSAMGYQARNGVLELKFLYYIERFMVTKK